MQGAQIDHPCFLCYDALVKRMDNISELQALSDQICNCTLCPLAKTRTKAVPGEGSTTPPIMFIGEGPGYNEDQQGRPFVGQAGRLLEQLLASIGLQRSDVFIANMVKCRPPNNRDPLPGEIEACKPYLDRQIELLKPKVIVTLGRYSLAKFFPKETISKSRGRPRKWNGIIIFPIYHPAAALRQMALKVVLEKDFQMLPSLVKEEHQRLPEEAPGGKQLNMFSES